MKILILFLTLLSLIALGADDILKPSTAGGMMYLKDSSGITSPAMMVYSTDGNGNIVTAGGITPVSDVLVKPSTAGGALYVRDNTGATLPAFVAFTTDGSGNISPLNSISGGTPSIAQQLWINKDGVDSANCGPPTSPCLTIAQAQTNITDASSSKGYLLQIGPGIYTEVAPFSQKQFVSWRGSGSLATLISTDDFSDITLSYNGTNTFRMSLSDLLIIPVVVYTRIAGTPVPPGNDEDAQFNFNNVTFASGFTATGSGGVGIGDRYSFVNVESNTSPIEINAATIVATNLIGNGELIIRDVGVDGTLPGPALIQNITGSFISNLRIKGFNDVRGRYSKINRIFLEDTAALYNGDAVSYPAGNASNGLTFSGGSTMSQITYATNNTRIKNAIKTVTSSPNTLNAFNEYVAVVKLTVAGPVTINLPSLVSGAALEGKEFLIIDGTGDAATNNITINRGGTDTFFGGATTLVISENNGWRKIVYRSGIWYVVSSTASSGANTTLSNLGATAVNANIVPGTTNTIELGTGTKRWIAVTSDNYTVHNGAQTVMELMSLVGLPGGGAASSLRQSTNGGSLGIFTNNSGFGQTGDLKLQTGNATAGTDNSGAISLQTGTSLGGIRGIINLNGSQVDVNSSKIVNAADPTSTQDVATKNYVDKTICYDSAASAGGSASESLTVTGLAATDTVMSITQKTAGANNTAITSYGAPGTNAITIGWTADPGAGAVERVCVRKQ